MVEQPGRSSGTVQPTRVPYLLLAALIGVLGGLLLAGISKRVNGVAPTVEWTSVIALGAIAGALAVLAHSTHRAVHRDRRRIDPHRAVSYLLLAKSSALAGASVAGGYLGFGLRFVGDMEAELPRERVIRALCAAVAGVAIVITGLLLERACRIPKPPGE